MERTVGGRPGRLVLDQAACRPLIRSRCQRSTGSGRTSNRIRRSACGLKWCSSAASKARSGRANRTFPFAQLAFQYRDLVAQDQDLGVLVLIAHRNKTHDRERVRHSQVGQSQQHSRSSCRDDHLAVAIPVLYQGDDARHPGSPVRHDSHLHGWGFRHAQSCICAGMVGYSGRRPAAPSRLCTCRERDRLTLGGGTLAHLRTSGAKPAVLRAAPTGIPPHPADGHGRPAILGHTPLNRAAPAHHQIILFGAVSDDHAHRPGLAP
jgi:hypothetical protein